MTFRASRRENAPYGRRTGGGLARGRRLRSGRDLAPSLSARRSRYHGGPSRGARVQAWLTELYQRDQRRYLWLAIAVVYAVSMLVTAPVALIVPCRFLGLG